MGNCTISFHPQLLISSSPILAHHHLTQAVVTEHTSTFSAVANEGAAALFLKSGPHTPFDLSELSYTPIYRDHFVNY